MKLLSKFWILVFLFWNLMATASDVKFYSLNTLHDISIRGANSVCKDQDGFIWASAKLGIIRLTDDDYRIYPLPFKTPAFYYIGLVQRDKLLLAFTNNGQLFKYNRTTDRFELQVNLGEVIGNQYVGITSVLIESAEKYWIATSLGLYAYWAGSVQKVFNEEKGIDKMEWFDDHSFFLVSNNEIQLINIDKLEKKVLHKEVLSAALLTHSLYFDKSQNRLWIGSNSNGLSYFDLTQNTFHPSFVPCLPKQPVLCLEPLGTSKLLLGIDGQGIWEVCCKTGQVIHVYKEDVDNPNSLPGNGVYDIFSDSLNNRVWVCSISGGVSYFELISSEMKHIYHQVNDQNSLANNYVNGIVEDRQGDLWFASNNGISCWRNDKKIWNHYYNNTQDQAQVFLTVCEDDQGQIWAGTYASGIYVIDRNNGKQIARYAANLQNSPISNNFIFDIRKGRSGDIWISGINCEVVNYQPKEDRFIKYAPQASSVIYELSDEMMLLGCYFGLCQLNKSNGELTLLIDSCIVNDIMVHEEKIWVATGGDGLYCLDQKTGLLEQFTTENGLPSNMVNSIGYVNNSIWIGTENGLCQLDLSKMNVILYAFIPVLANSSFNAKAFCQLRNGQLAWGTNNGVVIFDPKTIKQGLPEGKIFLQDITVSGRSVRDIPSFKLSQPLNEIEGLILNYSQKNLTVELLPIGATYGSKFSWKMEGIDEHWHTPANHRILTYSNLPGKKMKLKIRMYDNSLLHLLDERTLVIKMKPPFWGTWWFFILVFVLVSSVIYASIWYYISILKQKQAEEKVRFITNTSHDVRNSLSLIQAPIEELKHETHLSEAGRNYLHLAIEQTRRLSSVVTQLMDFQKVDIGKERLLISKVDVVKLISNRRLMFESMAVSRNIELVFTHNRPSCSVVIDEIKMEKIVDNLISNAVKYSHEGSQVHIDLNCDDDKWVLTVTDHGIGINRKAQHLLFNEFHRGENAINSKVVGSGIGLLLVKKYVAMHGGKISCTSQENEGSTFKLVMPCRGKIHWSKFEERENNSTTAEIVPDDDLFSSSLPLSDDEPDSKEMKVLIVEDNDDLRDFIKSALSRQFDVHTAADGSLGWGFIRKQLPDLVVSDVLMPNMDGFKLCELMKSTSETSHIPIILLTGLSEKTKQLHGLGLGADDYLTKPFDINLLKQKIKTIIRNREVVREKAMKLFKGSRTEPLVANELNDKFLKDILDVARANISNTEFSKDLFALALNMSPSLLYKKIKALTNQSPTDFIKIVRLDHALELLQSRKHTVTEVSELCGFTSVGYFSTVFRKHFGKSPSDLFE